MQHYVHNLDPFAIQFTETFGIRWYGLSYLAAFVVGYYAVRWMAEKGKTFMKPNEVADFVTYVAVGVLAGGRLGYCLFYSPDLLVHFDSSFPFWGVLKVNEGGMASHGGILGVMLVCWIYARRKKQPFMHILDLCVFGGAAGFFFGRLANFINGELYGRVVTSPTFQWAVQFPQEMYLWTQRDHARLGSLGPAAEALGAVNVDGQSVPITQGVWQGWVSNYVQDVSSRRYVNDAIEAMVQATQHGNLKVTEALGLVLSPRHASQLYQAVLEGLLVFIILTWMWRTPRKPGVVAAWWGILYCAARIIGEQFRMPDAHIGFQWLGLTRGQWLSVAMLAAGFAFWWIARTRKTAPLGGWGAKSSPAKESSRK